MIELNRISKGLYLCLSGCVRVGASTPGIEYHFMAPIPVYREHIVLVALSECSWLGGGRFQHWKRVMRYRFNGDTVTTFGEGDKEEIVFHCSIFSATEAASIVPTVIAVFCCLFLLFSSWQAGRQTDTRVTHCCHPFWLGIFTEVLLLSAVPTWRRRDPVQNGAGLCVFGIRLPGLGRCRCGSLLTFCSSGSVYRTSCTHAQVEAHSHTIC